MYAFGFGNNSKSWQAACETHPGSGLCNCAEGPGAGVAQNLDEMEFARSACAAAQSGDVAKLQRILARSPDALHSDGGTGNSGYTPLHYAARAGKLEAVQLLIKSGANVNAATREGRATSLHRAAAQGHLSVVEALVAAGADGVLQDADGECALHKAAAEGHLPVCQLLLDLFPGSRDLEDRRKRTPEDRAKSNAAAPAFLSSF